MKKQEGTRNVESHEGTSSEMLDGRSMNRTLHLPEAGARSWKQNLMSPDAGDRDSVMSTDGPRRNV